MTKTTEQIEREIAAALRKNDPKHRRDRRIRHLDQPDTTTADDLYAVATDILRAYQDAPKGSDERKRLLERFTELRMEIIEKFPNAKPPMAYAKLYKRMIEKPGMSDVPTETKPGVITHYVPGHGYFSAPVLTYFKYRRMPRARLIKMVLNIYEGSSYHGGKGDKAAHWKDYGKESLAIIAADSFGDDA